MAAASDQPDVDVGTQPASFDDFAMDSASTVRPMATQAIYRPQFEDDDDSIGSVGTEPEAMHHPTVARKLSPTRRLGGGLVEIPPVSRDRPAQGVDGQSRCRRGEAVLLELRSSGGPLDRRQ